MKTINIIIAAVAVLALTMFPQNVSANNQIGAPQQQASSTLVWEHKPDMPTARYNMGAAVSGGKIYVIGGDNYTCTPLTNVEEYDPVTGTWSIRTGMPTGRWGLGAVTGPDGKIYAMGGMGGDCGSTMLNIVEVYDPATDSWETGTSMPTQRIGFGVASANGKIYVFGGEDNSDWMALVEEYDPATDSWTRKADMPYKNKYFAITSANNGKIYLVDGDANAEELWEYDPTNDTWNLLTKLPTPRFGAGMTQASNGRLYVIGGESGPLLGTVESYDLHKNRWSVETGISTLRSGHRVVSVGDYIYVLGGVNESGPLSSVEAALALATPPPSNDNFADATAIISLPFSDVVDNTEATTEDGEPQSCEYSPQTVWYSFTPSVNMAVRADMSGSSFDDMIFSVYRSEGPRFTFTYITCGEWDSSVDFNVQAGETYYIQAGSMYSGGGDLHFNLQKIPPPANDDFASATVIPSALPFEDVVDTHVASIEPNEPKPSCAYSSLWGKTVWYAFIPETSGLVTASIPWANFSPVFAAYSGDSLADLEEIGCRQGDNLNFHVDAGATYHFQIGADWGDGGPISFRLENTPPPLANFWFDPYDPSVFDTIQFYNNSYDPGDVGFQSVTWDFGDGTTSTDWHPTHKYSADGDYTVQLAVTTLDGRTASSSQVVHVKTHDVAITKVSAPLSAYSGQTRAITISVSNKRYSEYVQVDLYKSVSGGFQWVNTLTLRVPVSSGRKTTQFTFNYKFTSSDASVGKVTFKAVATIVDARDVLPADNELTSSPPTKVTR